MRDLEGFCGGMVLSLAKAARYSKYGGRLKDFDR
jgi:hypothetical protein